MKTPPPPVAREFLCHVPVTVEAYHWTPMEFDAFDLEAPSTNLGTVLPGAYLSDFPYVWPLRSGRLIHAEVSMANPFVFDLARSAMDIFDFQDAAARTLHGEPAALAADLAGAGGLTRGAAAARARGLWRCDGIIVQNVSYHQHRAEFILSAMLCSTPAQIKIREVQTAEAWLPARAAARRTGVDAYLPSRGEQAPVVASL